MIVLTFAKPISPDIRAALVEEQIEILDGIHFGTDDGVGYVYLPCAENDYDETETIMAIEMAGTGYRFRHLDPEFKAKLEIHIVRCLGDKS